MTRQKRLSDVVRAAGLQGASSLHEDPWIAGVSNDTRTLHAGDLFVAIRGTADRGAAYIDRAVASGASAIVADEAVEAPVPVLRVRDAREALAALADAFFDHPTREIFTVGVTGTNGKTTVCHWSAHLLGSTDIEVVTTVANERSGSSGLTTPAPPFVQAAARRAVDRGARGLILEASSIGLAQRRLDAVAFDVASFTNLTPDHLDWHRSMADYEEAKALLFRRVCPDGWAVVPQGDPVGERMLSVTEARPFRVGTDRRGDLACVNAARSAGGVRCTFVRGRDQMDLMLPDRGPHTLENALIATGIALCAGRRLRELAPQLATLPSVRGRWERFLHEDGREAVVDFAHNPDGLSSVLQALRARHRRVGVVFGVPGDATREKRRAMGCVAGRRADAVWVTTDNPKDEEPEAIAADCAEGAAEGDAVIRVCLDRPRAIEEAVSWADAGDVVLVAGKGHETTQIVAGMRVPHSDSAVLERLGFDSGLVPEFGKEESAIG